MVVAVEPGETVKLVYETEETSQIIALFETPG